MITSSALSLNTARPFYGKRVLSLFRNLAVDCKTLEIHRQFFKCRRNSQNSASNILYMNVPMVKGGIHEAAIYFVGPFSLNEP